MATDMLVDLRTFMHDLRAEGTAIVPGVEIRRAVGSDREGLSSFLASDFEESWQRATAVAYSRQPVSAFVAVRGSGIVGFAFYDLAFYGYFGPMGVRESERGRGIGTRLLVVALGDMASKRYAYAVIGDVGPIAFYERACGATVIAGSSS